MKQGLSTAMGSLLIIIPVGVAVLVANAYSTKEFKSDLTKTYEVIGQDMKAGGTDRLIAASHKPGNSSISDNFSFVILGNKKGERYTRANGREKWREYLKLNLLSKFQKIDSLKFKIDTVTSLPELSAPSQFKETINPSRFKVGFVCRIEGLQAKSGKIIKYEWKGTHVWNVEDYLGAGKGDAVADPENSPLHPLRIESAEELSIKPIK